MEQAKKSRRGSKRTRKAASKDETETPSQSAKKIRTTDEVRKYTGVEQHKMGKWRARYNDITGRRKWVKGFFKTQEEAARARDAAIAIDGAPGQVLCFGGGQPTVSVATVPVTPKAAPPPGGISNLLSQVQGDCAKFGCQTLEELFSMQTPSILQLLIAALATEKKKAVEQENFQLAQSFKERIQKLKLGQLSASLTTPVTHVIAPQTSMAAIPAILPQTPVRVLATPQTNVVETQTPSVQPKSAKSKKQESKTPKQASVVERPQHYSSIAATMDAISKLCRSTRGYRSTYGPLEKKFSANVSGDWIVTKASSKQKSKKQPRFFALDCEMVMATVAPKKSNDGSDSSSYTESESEDNGAVTDAARLATPEVKASGAISTLARISLVEVEYDTSLKDGSISYNMSVVLDEYVKPPSGSKVVDYLTRVSGVTEENLSTAKLDLAQARQKMLSVVSNEDFIIGHSLQSDLSALHLWHQRVLDTALVFEVKDMPNITCSLKDVAFIMERASTDYNSDDSGRVADFQPKGASHDSCTDAKFAAKVAIWLIERELEANDGKASDEGAKLKTLPHILTSLPLRFMKRLTLHNIPASVKEKHIARIFKKCFPDLSREERTAKISMKPLKWSSKRTGKKLGSTTVEFDTKSEAMEVFKRIPVNEEECHPEGYPDQQGNLHKLVPIPVRKESSSSSGKESVVCEISTYFHMDEVDEEPTRTLHVAPNVAGKIFGKKGARVIAIQKRTGTKIVSEKLTDAALKKAKVPKVVVENGRNIALHIHADSESKAQEAYKMLHSALKGDSLGVSDE